MFTVHHLENSRSHRIVWLMEELELPYELKIYKRHPKTMRAPEDLKAVHPLGKSPVVTIDDVVLAESGAILEELASGTALCPEPGTEAYRRYLYWLHYAEGSLMPPLLVALVTSKIRTAKVPFFVKPIASGIVDKIDGQFTNDELDKSFGWCESTLAKQPWFAGDEFSAADIQMSYPLEVGRIRAPRVLPAVHLF